MFNRNISIDDPELEDIQAKFTAFMKMTSKGWYRTLLMAPLGSTICRLFNLPRVSNFIEPELDIIDRNIALHWETYQPDHMRDITDM